MQSDLVLDDHQIVEKFLQTRASKSTRLVLKFILRTSLLLDV